MSPHSPHTCCCHLKNKRVKSGKLQKAMLFQKSANTDKECKSVSSGCSAAQALSLMSPLWTRFDSISGCVWFVVNKAVLVQIFVLVFVFFCPCHSTSASYSSSLLYYSYHKTSGRNLETVRQVMLLRTPGAMGQKSTFASSVFTSFMLQYCNFFPVYVGKKVERA